MVAKQFLDFTISTPFLVPIKLLSEWASQKVKVFFLYELLFCEIKDSTWQLDTLEIVVFVFTLGYWSVHILMGFSFLYFFSTACCGATFQSHTTSLFCVNIAIFCCFAKTLESRGVHTIILVLMCLFLMFIVYLSTLLFLPTELENLCSIQSKIILSKHFVKKKQDFDHATDF